MRSFGQLLAEYMARTGVSDSELARTLGVRRQTIFRWKEGLVEKPRHREDVLRCAARLRLTAEERDELLLAAGFPPESARASLPALPPVSAEAAGLSDAASPVERVESSELGAVGGVTPRLRPRSIPRRALLAVAALSLLTLVASGAGFLSIRQGAGRPYPVAGPGETLVVVGFFGSPGKPQTEGGSPPNSLNARLQAALEREIQAARLDRVRVATWPEEIGDDGVAESIRRRAGASVVLGGGPGSGNLLAAFTLSSAMSRAEDLALDALVATPTKLRMSIAATSPEETQALALLILSQLHTRRGDFGPARAALGVALANPPADRQALASLYLYLGYLYQVSEPPGLDQAILAYGKAIDLSERWVAYLNRGLASVRLDRPAEWRSDLARALALQPDDAGVHQALCWAYALELQPELALPHCDAAVSRSPAGYAREARGVVYAELGRQPEAAADMQSFVDWLGQQPESLRARYGMVRTEWVQALKAGKNPIDPPALEELRRK